jgi:hypothetical protein
MVITALLGMPGQADNARADVTTRLQRTATEYAD